MRQSDFSSRYGSRVTLSAFMSSHAVNPTDMWEERAEEVELPTDLHFVNGSLLGCDRYPVSFLAAVYKGYGRMAPVRRNPQ